MSNVFQASLPVRCSLDRARLEHQNPPAAELAMRETEVSLPRAAGRRRYGTPLESI